MRRRRPVGLLVAAALLAACGPTPTTSPAAALPDIPGSLRDLPLTTIRLDGRSMRVAVAETTDARRRGLMGVADLGSLDGLLFMYAAPTPATFHMRDVPIPLDIAFFDADGRLLGVTRMDPCPAEPCPTYPAPGPIRWAIETEAGDLSDLASAARLSLEP